MIEKNVAGGGAESNGVSPVSQFRLIHRDWRRFQHYRDRKPPWIKLHRSLLDDPTFIGLPIESRALAPLLWLLASEAVDGSFDGASAALAFRLRLPEDEVTRGLQGLVHSGLVTVLAGCLHGASTTQAFPSVPLSTLYSVPSAAEEPKKPTGTVPGRSEDFEAFWAAYDRKVAKPDAQRAWRKIKPDEALAATIAERAAAYAAATPDKVYRAHPATWLNRRGWEDELPPPKTNGKPNELRARMQHIAVPKDGFL